MLWHRDGGCLTAQSVPSSTWRSAVIKKPRPPWIPSMKQDFNSPLIEANAGRSRGRGVIFGTLAGWTDRCVRWLAEVSQSYIGNGALASQRDSPAHLPPPRWRKPEPEGFKLCHFGSTLTAAAFSVSGRWVGDGERDLDDGRLIELLHLDSHYIYYGCARAQWNARENKRAGGGIYLEKDPGCYV